MSGLFLELFPAIQSERPDLVERHSLELVHALPQLRRSLTVSNPTLTDLSSNQERVRSYPADRAFRTVHGLIELLANWKTRNSPDTPWVIACDGYDHAGAMSSCFFKELIRRRGESLHIRLLATVDSGNGEKTSALFHSTGAEISLVPLDVPADSEQELEPSAAAEMASRLEERIGDDRIEKQIHLCELLRLWRQAGRHDKLLRLRWFGLDLYNTLGLYTDALRYADGLLELAIEKDPDNKTAQWSIIVKVLNALIGLQDVPATLALAEGTATKLAEPVPEWRGYLFYMLAMLYARYEKPRNLAKGESIWSAASPPWKRPTCRWRTSISIPFSTATAWPWCATSRDAIKTRLNCAAADLSG